MSEPKTVTFTMREHYTIPGDNGIKVRKVPITAVITEDDMGTDHIEMVREDTKAQVWQYQMGSMELINERDYLAISAYGGWGRHVKLVTALENMLGQSGLTKPRARKLEVVRLIRVYECAPGTGWVEGMGGARGVCLTGVDASEWLSTLWDIVKPRERKADAMHDRMKDERQGNDSIRDTGPRPRGHDGWEHDHTEPREGADE